MADWNWNAHACRNLDEATLSGERARSSACPEDQTVGCASAGAAATVFDLPRNSSIDVTPT